MRLCPIAALTFVAMVSQATTLERLALDDMIQKSTEIVRGRVMSAGGMKRGSMIYTRARVQVIEWWKGKAAASIDVHVPGGVYGGERQIVSGAPQLKEGYEYVLFLWTGRSGMTQVIGLSQGVFDLKMESADKQVEAYRAASTQTMLDSETREPVVDTPVRMKVSELRDRVKRAAGAASQ
jgi:hypothetical protein